MEIAEGIERKRGKQKIWCIEISGGHVLDEQFGRHLKLGSPKRISRNSLDQRFPWKFYRIDTVSWFPPISGHWGAHLQHLGRDEVDMLGNADDVAKLNNPLAF